MIIDTSALVAVLNQEPQWRDILEILRQATKRRMSSATLVEARIVMISKKGAAGRRALDRIIRDFRIEVEDLTERQADLAADAFRDYGRGSGSQAGLHFGDCFSYALADETGEPLLYVGADFSHTEIGLRSPRL